MESNDVGGSDFSLPLPLANAKNRQLQQKVSVSNLYPHFSRTFETLVLTSNQIYINQVRDKRNRLAQLLLDVDQNENITKVAEQDIASLEQSTQQTSVSIPFCQNNSKKML